MSCLLDKLAPETRTIIYEYVLSFDTPLQHITKMQPFVEKLTGVEPATDSRTTGSETETNTVLQRVNTSILAVSKLIYTEAIAVFYERNTILFDSHTCQFESLVSPHATDLSLARQITVKIDDEVGLKVSDKIGSAVEISETTVPAIFPSLRTCSIHISVDTDQGPSALLVSLASTLRGEDMCNEVYFPCVGLVHAVVKDSPCIKLVLQSRWTIDRWAKPEPIPTGGLTLTNVSATSLYQASRAKPPNI
jgi:hypothetical protein